MSTNKVTTIGINIFRADELKFVSLYLNHGISCEYTKPTTIRCFTLKTAAVYLVLFRMFYECDIFDLVHLCFN